MRLGYMHWRIIIVLALFIVYNTRNYTENILLASVNDGVSNKFSNISERERESEQAVAS